MEALKNKHQLLAGHEHNPLTCAVYRLLSTGFQIQLGDRNVALTMFSIAIFALDRLAGRSATVEPSNLIVESARD
jgi:hypothetical protein